MGISQLLTFINQFLVCDLKGGYMTNFISLTKACYLRLFFGVILLKAINVTAADREYHVNV